MSGQPGNGATWATKPSGAAATDLSGTGLSGTGLSGTALPAAVPGLYVDLRGRAAYLDGRSVTLTAREYLLIELLYSSRGRLFSRDDILERLWGLDFPGDDRIVDTYVKRLRARLGQGSVQTVRGLGYRCPLAEGSGVAQPHLEKLPPEARLLTLLAGRILQVTDPEHIMVGVYDLVREQYGVGSVSLWSLPTRTRLAQAGPEPLSPKVGSAPGGPASGNSVPGTQAPADGPAQAVVALGTGVPGEEPWALLVFAAQNQPSQNQPSQNQPSQSHSPWSTEVRPALDAVAGLVNPALRLNGEILRRQHAEAQIRSLNHDLEARVQARTRDLARANADLRSLYNLAQQLSGAASLHDIWSRGLSGLARLCGASVCALWRLDGPRLDAAGLNAAGLNGAGPVQCLAAVSPEGLDLRSVVQRQAEALALTLRGSLGQVSGPDGELRRLSRRAALPGGGQALVIPVAPSLSQSYALYLELPADFPAEVPGDSPSGEAQPAGMPDLGLLDAAARAFGLAFERQMQTLTLEHAALSDELTGLPNRRALLADLTGELAYSQRHASALTLSLFEITDIRAVNLRLGFAAGNDLIRSLASALSSALRTEDRLYRLGGAVLASLVRSGQTPGHQTPGQSTGQTQELPHTERPHTERPHTASAAALGSRLSELVTRFEAAPSPAWPYGGCDVRVSHVQAPSEAGDLSAVLRLALERLNPDHPDPDHPDPDHPSAGHGGDPS